MSRDLLNDPTIDWSSGTFDGARLSNHRLFCSFSFSKKLAVIESLADYGRETMERLQRSGRPYVDPYTRKLVRGRSAN